MNEPIWKSALRAMLKTFFITIGIGLAVILLLLGLSAIDSTEDSIPSDFTPKILPNHLGVRKKMSKSAPVILQIDIQGLIGALELTQQNVEKLLVESREGTLENDRVKGILLRINSPGGTLTDADGIYQALKEYKTRYGVPVLAYIDGLCASGGMYVACAADEVYANDVSLVGSVGVITSAFMNFSKLMEKVGVDSLTISAGKGKDDLDPLRPWKPGEGKNIEEIIQYYYQSFAELVTKSRPRVGLEALISDYGAQVFPAESAEKIGFIDGIHATRDATLKKLLAKLAITDDYYQVVRLESSNWLNQLFKADSSPLSGKITHQIRLDGQLPENFYHTPLLLYRP